PQLEKSCIRTSSINNIQLNECRVPESQRLGQEGQAFDAIVPLALNWDRAAVWGGRLGRLRSILEDSVVYASKRVQFGKPIGKHQSIGFKLADMKVRLDAAECLLQRALNIVNETPQDNITIPLARLFLGESVMAAAIDAAQILGGYGFYPENHVERYYRDAK